MNVQSAAAARIPTTAITALIVDALGKVGVPVDDASKIAALMLEADLVGADAHGVFRLPQYSQRLKLGSTNPRPNITVNGTAPATALVAGDNGMGHLVVARAAEPPSNSRASAASRGSAAACQAMPAPPAFTRRCRSKPI